MTNIIKVKFLKDGQAFGREYSYLTPEEVEVNDIVEMETKTGTAKGIVTQINVPEAEIVSFKDKMKTIVGKYLEEPKCRVCGCTQDIGCPEGCYWVEEDLCSECVGKEQTND